jgi:hypothetical protein
MDERRSVWLPALLGAMYLVGLFAATYAPFPVSDTILASHRVIYPMVSTIVGKFVYVFLLGTVGVVCAWRMLRFGGCVADGTAVDARWFVVAVGVIFLLGSPVSIPYLVGFWSVCLGMALWPRVLPARLSARNQVVVNLSSGLVVILFLLLCVAFPFGTPVVASEGAQLVSLQNHYVMYMPGLVRAFWSNAAPFGVLNYGLGSALFIELCSRVLKLATDVDVVIVIKWVHIGFLVSLALLLRILRPGGMLQLCALIALASPTLSLLSPVLYYPNLSGIRFVPFIGSIAALAIVSRSGTSGLSLLATVGGGMALYAPESGLVVCAALLVFVVLRAINRGGTRLGLSTGIRFLGFAGGVTVLGKVLEMAFFRQFQGVEYVDTFFYAFIEGYCGISEFPSPFSTVVFIVGVYVVLSAASRAAEGRLHRWHAYQAAIGVMMLGWLFYYVHRMHPYNLFFQGALMVLLVAPRLSCGALRLVRSACGARSRGRIHSGAACVILIAATFSALAFDAVSHTVGDFREQYARTSLAQTAPALVSSMRLVSPYSQDLVRQLAVLQSISVRRDVLVLTNLSVEARQLGFNLNFPWYDPFIDVLTRRSRDDVVRWIDNNGPPLLLVDDPDSKLSQSVPPQTDHLQSIVSRLSAYRPSGGEDGWLRFERIADQAGP